MENEEHVIEQMNKERDTHPRRPERPTFGWYLRHVSKGLLLTAGPEGFSFLPSSRTLYDRALSKMIS